MAFITQDGQSVLISKMSSCLSCEFCTAVQCWEKYPCSIECSPYSFYFCTVLRGRFRSSSETKMVCRISFAYPLLMSLIIWIIAFVMIGAVRQSCKSRRNLVVALFVSFSGVSTSATIYMLDFLLYGCTPVTDTTFLWVPFFYNHINWPFTMQ